MKLNVVHQESYSRGQLLLRSFFGYFYILIPHAFVLMFLQIWSGILSFFAFWAVLFTGKYPKSMFEFQVKLLRWNLRLSARMYNLSDGYPAFGLNAQDEFTQFEVTYPEKLSQGDLILKVLFGFFYVLIPHVFVLLFRSVANMVIVFVAWFAVLFTGKYPQGMHDFNVGTIRWSTRLTMYMGLFMTDKYPAFSGNPDSDETASAV